MSKQTITKEVEAVICDFCAKEIDTRGNDYCYHHLRTSGEAINTKKYKVTHYLFSRYRPTKKPAIGTEYVQYDFHAACFDKLMQKFLAERKTPHES